MAFLETKYQKKSLLITIILHGILLVILFFFGFTYLDPPPENGIAINFGTSEVGSGNTQPTKPIASAPKKASPEVTPPEPEPIVEDKVVTQELEESPVVEKKKVVKKPVETEKPKEKPKEELPAKKPDPKPDKSTTDAMSSILNGPERSGEETGGEGNDNQAGDKGDPDGDPKASSYYGNGAGLDGDGNYRLGGRKALTKQKFVQDCNESGIVVVRIEVNREGKVISATPGVKGTTNNASCLTDPARRAALATQFNSDADAPSRQIGTIIYNFKLSE
ncbi:energy transducer TonB [Zunongwangia sp.]|uniref:energy transducer TonB n=1 Tax=Zunongwangia sp. TaxID=1965325 RepID=UPI003AA96775